MRVDWQFTIEMTLKCPQIVTGNLSLVWPDRRLTSMISSTAFDSSLSINSTSNGSLILSIPPKSSTGCHRIPHIDTLIPRAEHSRQFVLHFQAFFHLNFFISSVTPVFIVFSAKWLHHPWNCITQRQHDPRRQGESLLWRPFLLVKSLALNR